MKKSFSTSSILTRLAFWLFLAVVVAVTATAMFSDFGRVVALFKTIEISWLPLIIASVLFNYLLRFGKWCFFLRIVEVRIPLRENLWVFFSAFTMVLSPGKIGELVKSFLLKARFNIAASKTAPVVMAERLTDLLGLMTLCFIGFTQFAFGGKTLLVVGLLLLAIIVLLTREKFWAMIDHLLARFKGLSRFRRPVKVIQESTRDLFSFKSLFIATLLSAVSWAGEGLALYLIFRAMNVEIPSLLLLSVFAHAFSSIVGALSFLPGGLLVTEGAMGMFFVYATIPDAQAISATFLIRAVTLWFAVILGTVVFLLGHTREDLAALQIVTSKKDSIEVADEAEV